MLPDSSPQNDSDPDRGARILVVDDDVAILGLIDTILKSKGMLPVTASTLAGAQEELEKGREFAVILCDHLLPDGLGIEFLRELRTLKPQLIRVLMTGVYDKAQATDATNSGEIYRFLVKPFTVEDLLATISQSVDQHDLIHENSRLHSQLALQNEELRRANAELARRAREEQARVQGLKAESVGWREASQGMIDLALGIVERIDPQLHKHGRRVSVLATAIGTAMNLPDETLEKLGTAALLHDLGLVGCAPSLRDRQRQPDQIANPLDRARIEYHPRLSAELAKFLPAPEIIEAIAQHHEYFDGSGYPDQLAGSRISLLARILTVADCYEEIGGGGDQALSRLAAGAGRLYDADVVHALDRALSKGPVLTGERQVLISELIEGLKLSSSIYTATGMLLVKQGQVLSRPIIEHLQLHAESNAITQKILVEA